MTKLLYLLLLIVLPLHCLASPPRPTSSTLLGRSINYDDIHFYLWTKSNSGDESYYVLEYGNSSNLKASPLDPSVKTYFLFHGLGSEGLDWWILEGKSRILSIEESNIISVDYGALAYGPHYLQVLQNVKEVANYTASYIDWLVKEISLKTSLTELVGYSLGAQTAGMTGYYTSSGNISRITGLDPGGPGYQNVPDTERLDKSDANFVDVIHTNSCPFLKGCWGLADSIGHADFYPNGGEHQPGCYNSSTYFMEIIVDCSHSRAPRYWLESILIGTANGTELEFVSWPCCDWKAFEDGKCQSCGEASCPNMGFQVEKSTRGKFYLRTKDTSPYALGDQEQIDR